MLVIETIPHHAQNWIARSAGKPRGLRDIAMLNRGKHFLDPFGITTKPAATPPKNSLDHHSEPDDRYNQNRPHDWTALVEPVDQPVAGKEAGFRGGRSSRCGTRGRCGRTLGGGLSRAECGGNRRTRCSRL